MRYSLTSASLLIASRYLHALKKRKIVHLMGIVACIGMAISTASLLLSNGVYNGLENLVSEVLKSIDPDIRITLKQGKFFDCNTDLLHKIQKIEGVESVMEAIEVNVMLLHGYNNAIACLKGVSTYGDNKTNRLQKYIVLGSSMQKKGPVSAIIGAGIACTLDIRHQDQIIEIRHINTLNKKLFNFLKKPYNSKKITIDGVFSIDKQHDEKFIITSLDFAQNLMQALGKISSIQVNLTPTNKKIMSVQNIIKSIIADDKFKVETIDEQQATLLQAIRIEKLGTKIIFIIIMIIAALNIFFALSILTLIKRKDIYTLYTIGANRNTIAKIFIITALSLSIRGAALGSILAYALAWVQQKYGVISLGANIAMVEAYPVNMHWNDFFYTIIYVVSTTLLASWIPARCSRKLLNQQ